MRMTLCALAVVSLVALSGCGVMALGPVVGAICIDEKGPVAMGDAKTGNKVGTAKAEGILIVGFGDASISTAMKNGSITRVHHVDSEVLNVLGIYARYQTTVYGE